MSLETLIARVPVPFDIERGREVSETCGLSGAAAELVAGAAGCSPFLAGLAVREAEWLAGAVSAAPRDALAGALSLVEAGGSRTEVMRDLRVAKRRVGLLTALCDLGGIWDLEEVTGALSRLADGAVQAALDHLTAEAVARGRLPETEARNGGLFVLAMGKLGADELNYSSDIDLIALFDESLYPGEEYPEVRKGFIRVVQQAAKMLSDVTEDGYVFRTDLRLRPDPSVTPVVIGVGAAERYYESQGRTWERAAMIKARVCAGDAGAGARFLNDIAPFIWRRHLDFAAIEDAHNMRLRIREHKGVGGPIVLPGHDVKLGRGGIREIEFFTQTRQLICGGRDPSLRLTRTKPALGALAEGGWITAEVAEEFSAAYTAHRSLEHRIQMLEDAQTHRYPAGEDARRRVAGLFGDRDLSAFEGPVLARFRDVDAAVERFFVHETGHEAAEGSAWADFPGGEEAEALVDGWQSLPALRSDRSRAIFSRLSEGLARRLREAARPEVALRQFDSFLKGLPAGVQVLSLFEANPQILDLLVETCATAPRLAEYLGRNSQVLDAVLTPDFFQPMADEDSLLEELDAVLAAAADYEGVLDGARVWTREHTFRVGVQLLRGLCSPAEAGEAYSAVAGAALRALLPRVVAGFEVRHGVLPGGALAVMGMGKFGSREMTARSDLDLIVIYDAPQGAQSDGGKPLPVSTYYARLTQALINALTAPTSQGVLYPVDMRLRPSGRQGPVATSLASFATYQAEEAWTWEHLAMTRSRVVAGDPELGARVEAARDAALARPRDRAAVLADVREMRARLGAARGAEAADPWEIKQGPGRMLDIEMALQAGRLLHPGVAVASPLGAIPGLVEAGYLSAEDGAALEDGLRRLQAVQHMTRLALDEGFSPERGGPGLAAALARVAGAADLDALEGDLAASAERCAAIVDRVLGEGG